MVAAQAEKLTPDQEMDAERLKDTWDQMKHSHRLSQKELASLWGVHPSNVSQYLHGYIPLNTEAKLWFAKYLRKPAHEIWPDFEFTEALTLTLPPASQEAAKLVAALNEDDQDTVLRLLRSMRPMGHRPS